MDSPISKSNSNATTRAHSSTLRSNASSAFYYHSGGRRRSRPFTYGFGVGERRKRSKGVQNWIRCLTVFAYFVLVSSPALLFSFYYTRIWDPTYLNKMVNSPSTGNSAIAGNSGSRRFMPVVGQGKAGKFSLQDILPKGTIGNG